MRFHVVDTITNGVELTEENIGKLVQWTSVMTDFVTGLHHRTNRCSGFYTGTTEEAGMTYAMFRDGYVNDTYLVQLGGPLARFRHED